MRDKTIIELFGSISTKLGLDRFCEPERNLLNGQAMLKARDEIEALGARLGFTPVQVVLFTVLLENSGSRIQMDYGDIAMKVGMGHINFLSQEKELEGLRDKEYIKIDKGEGVCIPYDVKKALSDNRPYEGKPMKGLDAAVIMTRLGDILSDLDDGCINEVEAVWKAEHLIYANPQTSIARGYHHHVEKLVNEYEKLVFFITLHLYVKEGREDVEWDDFDEYIAEAPLSQMQTLYKVQRLDLQNHGLVEYGFDGGFRTKEKFKIRDEVLNDILADIGGARQKPPVKATDHLRCQDIPEKAMFYNPAVRKQLDDVASILAPGRFEAFAQRLKERGMRQGIACIFYGPPGTGKTETVYQLGRKTRRDVFLVNVSQIKDAWVGESEKNIKAVFDSYRESVSRGGTAPILLFNEADAIFGIRNEGAGSSVDKMENTIQNIILQEMERLNGILVATTNLTANLDKAFERRFQYKIQFEQPDMENRARIWSSIIPDLSAGEAMGLAIDYNFSGGQIENVAYKKMWKEAIDDKRLPIAELRRYCDEERMDRGGRKIGFK